MKLEGLCDSYVLKVFNQMNLGQLIKIFKTYDKVIIKKQYCENISLKKAISL